MWNDADYVGWSDFGAVSITHALKTRIIRDDMDGPEQIILEDIGCWSRQ